LQVAHQASPPECTGFETKFVVFSFLLSEPQDPPINLPPEIIDALAAFTPLFSNRTWELQIRLTFTWICTPPAPGGFFLELKTPAGVRMNDHP
jgi:hypothetical protein